MCIRYSQLKNPVNRHCLTEVSMMDTEKLDSFDVSLSLYTQSITPFGLKRLIEIIKAQVNENMSRATSKVV